MLQSNDTNTNESKIGDQRSTKNPHKAVSSMLFIFIASLATYLHFSRRDQPLKPYIDTSSYYQEQSPKFFAGEIQYARIPVQYWEHRIMMVKALGLNSLSVYIMWNYHEIEKGKFDFQTENRNLDLFLRLAQKHEMKVLIRPGPYVCAEWDFGGLPSRLLADPQIQIRSLNQKFINETAVYFAAVAPIIREHLWSHQNADKCIIMLQIQNEYGFFGTDINYIMQLRRIWRNLNVITAQYYVQWFINVRKSHWQGANIGLNDAFTQVQIDYIRTTLETKGLVFGGEIYSGWLTFWHSQSFQSADAQKKVKQFQFLMSRNLSFSMYVAHGGTSFGLTAGANSRYVENLGFAGQLTSYDYDAPINEQGSATFKFYVFRDAIKKYASWDVPDVPNPIPMMKVQKFQLNPVMSLYQNIDWTNPGAVSKKPIVFESKELQMFHLGIVIYQFDIPPDFMDVFMVEAHDLAFISVDNQYQQTLDRTLEKHPNVPIQCKSKNICTVRIMVQAMGHINYDLSMKDDWKGIVQFQSINGHEHNLNWKMYTVPIHDNQLLDWENLNQNIENKPVLFKATVNIDEPADTYFNMKSFTKGYMWVNRRNLGRYWNVGPQLKLFCPGVWLKKGLNEIFVLDLRASSQSKHEIRGQLTLKDVEKPQF